MFFYELLTPHSTDSFVLGVDYHAYCFPKNLTFLYVLHKIIHKCCYIQCWADYLQSVTDSKLRKKNCS